MPEINNWGKEGGREREKERELIPYYSTYHQVGTLTILLTMHLLRVPNPRIAPRTYVSRVHVLEVCNYFFYFGGKHVLIHFFQKQTAQ